MMIRLVHSNAVLITSDERVAADAMREYDARQLAYVVASSDAERALLAQINVSVSDE